MLSGSFSPAQLAQHIDKNSGEKGLPPVEKWDPEFCGDIDMRIAKDGQWFYMGSPIGRTALVRMFSTILKREDDRYFLVTPVEKVGIQVDDVPFVITQQLEPVESKLRFVTNVGDEVLLDKEHPLTVSVSDTGEPEPYLYVRAGLMGRLHRNLFYQLIEQAETYEEDSKTYLGLKSDDRYWSLGEFPE